MNVLLNMSTLKKGGGQNVGLNFLQSLSQANVQDVNFILVAAKGSTIAKWVGKREDLKLILCPENPWQRILFELKNGRRIVKNHNIDIIFTYFGIGLYPKTVPQVIGSADSNLYFPEVDFWVEYKGVARLKRFIIDKFRIRGLKKASGVIYENRMMEERGRDLFQLQNTTYIKPSINIAEESEGLKLPDEALNADKVGLFLCGWQRNKNFSLIPEIVKEFASNGKDFHIIITAPKDRSEDYLNFEAKCKRLGVEDSVSVIGMVKKEQLKSLYNQVDYVFLLSKLESFSNNIIESWYFKKLLVINDAPWSRSICEDAALYVDRDSAKDIVNRILQLEASDSQIEKLKGAAKKMLESYPTIVDRTNQEIEYLRYVVKNN
jgi:glycosyltransferase involved in cell wall biosynthesis